MCLRLGEMVATTGAPWFLVAPRGGRDRTFKVSLFATFVSCFRRVAFATLLHRRKMSRKLWENTDRMSKRHRRIFIWSYCNLENPRKVTIKLSKRNLRVSLRKKSTNSLQLLKRYNLFPNPNNSLLYNVPHLFVRGEILYVSAIKKLWT